MVEIENDWLKVTIKNDGAEVCKVQHKENGLNYMWTGDSAYWGRVSPVLFPIVGRLKGDRYMVEGQTYHMSQHGFLRDVRFSVASQTKDRVSFLFESAGNFKNIYPYEFKVLIHYILQKNVLTVTWEVINDNEGEMYFSIGAHPAFKIPLLEEETIENYSLKFFPAKNKHVMEYELKESLLLEKGPADDVEAIQLCPSLFVNDALIYSNIDRITLTSNITNCGVDVMLKDFPFVGIWSKYEETDGSLAPFVCIEPWYGIADRQDSTGKLKEKFGVNRLAQEDKFRAQYSIRFI
ncbi:Protein LacX, plasmid [Bacillus sp. T2.9-1]|uniref:aldose 1-epimerase family protein n=1 Tax=Bacillus sp. T2.9-1 TaxID=3041163 RepID=UPI0024778617|nr:aldose 1-epimerase family protein [Bacillus sp. T2.9-1]CAI9395065.1 Protein LacX, plasmid [Bacillus sp. T2.9-1]